MGSGSSIEIQSTEDIRSRLSLITNRGKFHQNYFLAEPIGHGQYGQVFNCQSKKNGDFRVVKIVQKKILNQSKGNSRIINDSFILKQLDHPNILKAYETYEDLKYFYMVTEKCNGNDLIEFMKLQEGISEKYISQIIQQILEVLVHIKERNIVHRDLKPTNIIVSQYELDPSILKIKVIDWGSAAVMTEENLKYIVGTPNYMAPEVFKQCYDYRSDIWSLGVIFYQIISSQLPFKIKGVGSAYKDIISQQLDFQQEIWNYVSKGAKQLITYMLNPDQNLRIQAEEAIQHPWILKAPDNLYLKNSLRKECVANFIKFNLTNKLEKCAFSYISNHILYQSLSEDLYMIFKNIDKNGDGFLSKEEIQNELNNYLSEEFIFQNIQSAFLNADLDQNGFISYSEFITATMNKEMAIQEQNLKECFKFLDLDQNGFITKNELQNILGNCNIQNEEWQLILKEVDTDKDGQISYNEFKEMMIKSAN